MSTVTYSECTCCGTRGGIDQIGAVCHDCGGRGMMEGMTDTDRGIAATQFDEPGRERATPEQITRAVDEYGSDDIKIDDDALISDAMPEGVWIQAWLWLEEEDES